MRPYDKGKPMMLNNMLASATIKHIFEPIGISMDDDGVVNYNITNRIRHMLEFPVNTALLPMVFAMETNYFLITGNKRWYFSK